MRIPDIRQIRHAATVGTAALGLACAVLLADGMRGARKTADVGVVLGAKVVPNGRLSPRLASRLEAGIAAYEAGHVRNLLVSGATGKEGINEGEAMRDYLLWRGIPPERVATDPDGVDTGATACHAKAIMADRGWTTAAAVTSDYHVPRTKLALRMADVDVVGQWPSRLRDIRDVYAIPREIAAYVAYAAEGNPCE